MTQGAVSTNTSESIASQILGDVATPTQDAAATKVDPAATSESDKISPKLQILIRRERQAMEREKAAKSKETEVAEVMKLKASLEAKVAEFESLKKTNPLKALELLGMNYEDLTRAQLNDGTIPPEVQVKQVEEKFDKFVRTQEEALQRQAEEAKKLAERQLAENTEKFKGEIETYLTQNNKRYEFIAFEQSQELVYDVIQEEIERTYNAETGAAHILTIAEAADKVEAHLEKKYEKARELSKVKALLNTRTVQNAVTKPENPSPRQMPKTLNNNLSASPSKPRTAPISDEERIAKAIAYARGLRP